ncbi:MAG: hypothetical protein O7F70_10325 [Gemmatimonadetes bacterium]|nr:hypothetical protein [Gemmatimonadota bacterium]
MRQTHSFFRATHKSALLIAVAALAACGLDSLPDDPQVGPLEGEGTFGSFVWSGGRQRTYEIFIPPDEGGMLPLLIFYHGRASTGAAFQNITRLDAIALRERFVVVYPDGWGTEGSWGVQSGFTIADQLLINDVLFASTLIDHISEELPIDQNRVYVAGFSQGGMMTQTIACLLSKRIAAVLTVAATPHQTFTQQCIPERAPFPMMLIIGTEDTSFPWGGSSLTLSVRETVEFWARKFNCNINPVVENLPDTEDDGTTVVRDTYNGCDLILYTIEGGGHTWPGASVAFDPSFGVMSREINASEVIVEFMLRHTLQ